VLRVNADQGGEAVRIGTDLGRENAALAACWFDQTVGRMDLGRVAGSAHVVVRPNGSGATCGTLMLGLLYALHGRAPHRTEARALKSCCSRSLPRLDR